MAVLISGKVEFRAKKITKEKEENYMIEKAIHQEKKQPQMCMHQRSAKYVKLKIDVTKK